MYTIDNDNENEFIGNINEIFKVFEQFLFYYKEYNSKMNLKFVKIYFYATTFDKITKDRAAKFVDMLSAVGGTMGLLTGFSIISAMEIVYFASKIILRILKDRVHNIEK